MAICGSGRTQGVAGLDRAAAIEPFLDGTLPSRPRPSTGSRRLVNAFPNLTFIDPVQMLPVPSSNRLMVVEKSVRLFVYENLETRSSKTVLLDIRSQVESSHDSGIMGLTGYRRTNVTAEVVPGIQETRLTAPPRPPDSRGVDPTRTKGGRRGFKGLVRATSLLGGAKHDEVKLLTRPR